MNTDFDALASLIAARKLYPEAQIVISDKQDNRVRRFMNIYRDTLDFVQDNKVDWDQVTELILVDVASLRRVSNYTKDLNLEQLHITVYDHHPQGEDDVVKDEGIIEQVGAAVTLLVEKIKEKSIPISSFEATLFGLGIYTDTGAFTFKNTTDRDFQAAAYLMTHGMNLEMIQQFSEQTLRVDQQKLLDKLFVEAKAYELDGLNVIITKTHEEKFVRDLSTLTAKLLEIKGADAVISIVGMNKNVFIVGRAKSERITLLPLLQKFGGGGHKHAGSATIKNGGYESVAEEVGENVHIILKPAITAKDIMTSPVKTIAPETTIEKAGQLMYRYGHSGYPVVEDDQLVGIITRRDLDKANHHGLGHAPVKAYMTTNMITINDNLTLEEVQQMVIDHNVGRLPVIKNDKLIGIISRTNIIEALHGDRLADNEEDANNMLKENVKKEMEQYLQEDIFSLLKDIGEVASKLNMPVYLVGGIVRDLFLQEQNDDIDIVIEGDGIEFVKSLQKKYGGDVMTHENFGTATWIHPSNIEIDIATSRLEYYDKPASLPDVEVSTLTEDLNRRDFTINAMAIYLNEDSFGTVIDPFQGQLDLYEKKIKTLHNISFVEDPTRIFRAIRFELRFNFLMDDQTETLALHSIDKVKNLSAERVLNEMERLFLEEDPIRAIDRLYELTFWHQLGVSDKSRQDSNKHAKKLQTLYKKETILIEQPTSFQYLLIPFYNSDNLAKVERFAITKNNARFLREIMDLKQKDIAQLQNIEELHNTLKIYSNDAIAFVLTTNKSQNFDLIISYLYKRDLLKPLLIGEDLSQLGIKPGPLYSKIFNELEMNVLTEQITTKDEAIKWVKQFIKKL